MSRIYLDINQFGQPHWLGPLARFDPRTIREYNRQQWLEAQAARRAKTDKRYGLDAGFDPSQERDEHGRWTREGQTKLGAKAGWIRTKIDAVADEMNYPKERIFMSKDDYKFNLNGATYSAGGVAINNKDGWTSQNGEHYGYGDIVIFDNQNGFEKDFAIGGIVAHEIQHQRWLYVMARANEEFDSAVKETDKLSPFDPSSDDYENMAKKYPVAAAIDATDLQTFNGAAKLEKSDGVTPYSRMWWEANRKNNVPFLTAVNETLAEIASLERTGDLKELAPEWRKLYDTINEQYKKLYSKKG